MPLSASVGQSINLDGRVAGAEATRQALDQLDGLPIQLGYVTAASQHNLQAVLSGVSGLLGNTPVLGMSSWGLISEGVLDNRAVQVMLVAGQNIQAQADFWPGYDNSSRGAARKMIAELGSNRSPEDLLFWVADGLQGNPDDICDVLAGTKASVLGVLASGDVLQNITQQLGGASAGRGGLAAALVSGDFRIGIGRAKSWQPIGPNYVISHVRERSIRTLDDYPAAQMYAKLLGYTASAWALPPLNRLVRLYPLGIENEENNSLELFSPLRVDPDGSLLFNQSVREGQLAFMMSASVQTCLDALTTAVESARQALGVKPVLGLIFADLAWQYLFAGTPSALWSRLRELLGSNLPLLGSYTMGHLISMESNTRPELVSQELLVVLVGEKS
jgi:hypothetical protein